MINISDKIKDVKNHVIRNKKYYIVGGVCITTGVVVGLACSDRMFPKVNNSNSLINKALVNIKPVINQSNTYVTQLVRRGHAGNVVKCIETGEEFASQNRAASLMGISPGTLSSHLKGKTDNAGGYTFEKVGDFNSQK